MKRRRGPNKVPKKSLPEIRTVFWRVNIKPQSTVTAERNIQQPVSYPASQKLFEFLDQLQKLSKDAFGVTAQAITEQLMYAKMPLHLKKSITQEHLGNSTFEQIVSHLEWDEELNHLEAPDELQTNTLTQQATKSFSE